MKEYLIKDPETDFYYISNDREYGFVAEIPEGAEIAILFNKNPDEFGVCFYKNNGKKVFNQEYLDWSDSAWTMPELLNENYSSHGQDLSHKILWQRETLNDKVVSAEEFRQEQVKNVALENLEQGLCGVNLKSDLNAVIGVELPDFKFPEPLPFSSDLDEEFPLSSSDVNYRVAKAFNVIRGTNLSEDDIHFVRELIALTESHYGGKK